MMSPTFNKCRPSGTIQLHPISREDSPACRPERPYGHNRPSETITLVTLDAGAIPDHGIGVLDPPVFNLVFGHAIEAVFSRCFPRYDWYRLLSAVFAWLLASKNFCW